jgi:hypothetical protein
VIADAENERANPAEYLRVPVRLYNTMNPIFEDPALPAKEIAEMRRRFYNKFYSPAYILRQANKGYIKGNLYSKIMTRTAINYNLWRAMSAFHR